MGFLRGLAKGLAGVIFLFLLSGLLMNLFFYDFTKPDFQKSFLSAISEKGFEKQNITPVYNDFVEKCKTQPSYIFSSETNMTLECSKITSQKDFSQALVKAMLEDQFSKSIPGFSLDKANLFLKSLFVCFGIAIIIFGVLLFLLSHGWPSKFYSLGTPFILIGILAIPLEIFKSKIGDPIFANSVTIILLKYMLISLVIGIILVAAGIAVAIKNRKKKKGNKKGRKK